MSIKPGASRDFTYKEITTQQKWNRPFWPVYFVSLKFRPILVHTYAQFMKKTKGISLWEHNMTYIMKESSFSAMLLRVAVNKLRQTSEWKAPCD